MRTRQGFTILETLIAAALAAIVLAVLWNLVLSGSRGLSRGSRRLDAVSEFNRVVTYLRRDARAILWKRDKPILLGEEGEARDLTFTVVQGVTLDGIPVAVPVVWTFYPGSGEGGAGELERVYSPGMEGQQRTRFFRGELASFELVKLDERGEELAGDDPRLPSFLECRLSHALGDHIAVRIAMHSRYQELSAAGHRGSYWFPNSQLRPVPLVFPVVATRSGGTARGSVRGRLAGSALLTSGQAMASVGGVNERDAARLGGSRSWGWGGGRRNEGGTTGESFGQDPDGSTEPSSGS